MERAQQAAERAAERARQAAERARERNDDNRSDSSSRGDGSNNSAASNSGGGSASNPTSASASAEKASGKSADAGDDKQGKDEKATRSERRSGRSDNSTDKYDTPPATVSEFFKRLTTPASDSSSSGTGKSEGQSSATSASPPPAIASTPLPTTTAVKPRTVTGPLQLPALPNARREVLAVNPSPTALAAARRLNFATVKTTTLPGLALTVTQLLPPDGMDAETARKLLAGSIADTMFALNKRYRPFRAATGEKDKPADAPREMAKATTAGGCAPARCFGPEAIGWKKDLRSCTAGRRIGVIDTPVDHRHPAFEHARLKVGTFIPEGRKRATPWHGTGILALLAGAPDSGTPGLIPDAEFFVGDIFHIDEDGQPSADTLSLLNALDWMDRWDVRIVNLSVAGTHDQLMQAAIDTMSRNGTIFVAAAGNEGPKAPPAYPAAYRNVVAVTAVAKDLRSYRHANQGDYIDLAAPGVDIWTAVPGAKETYQSGTSFAVPFATALIATMRTESRLASKDELLDKLAYVDLGQRGRDPIFGRGLISAPATCGHPSKPASPPAHTVSAPGAATAPQAQSGRTVPSLWQPSITYGFAGAKP